MADSDERSEGGARILRHAHREEQLEVGIGDERLIEAIGDHIEKHIGPVNNVFHEILSDAVHIDIYNVAPTPARNFRTLISCGMSSLPMKTPQGYEKYRYAELMICLPPNWPVGKEASPESNYWPVRWLKTVARLPHQYNTWLYWGHTVPNGDPAQPFAQDTKFCCMIVMPHAETSEGYSPLEIAPDRHIYFWNIVPIYKEEMDLKLKKGVDGLNETTDKAGLKIRDMYIVNNLRKNAAANLSGLRWFGR